MKYILLLFAFTLLYSSSFAQKTSKEERAVLAAYDFYIKYLERPVVKTNYLANLWIYSKTAFCVDVANEMTLFSDRRAAISAADWFRVNEELKTSCNSSNQITISENDRKIRKYFVKELLPEHLEQDTLHFILISHPVKIKQDIYYVEFAHYELLKGEFVVYSGDGKNYPRSGSSYTIDALWDTSFLYDDKRKKITTNGLGASSPLYCHFIKYLEKTKELEFFWDNKTYKCP